MNKTKMTFRFDQQLPETSREDKLQVLPYKNESITNEQRETDNSHKGTERNRGMKKNTVATQESEINEPEDLNKRISSRRFAPTLRVQEGWDDPFGRSAASWSDAEVLPDSLEEDEEAYHSVQEYRKRPPHPSRWKLVGSVASALVTGGMFGYIMLLLFNGGGMVQDQILQ